jgi:hypothetical protein
LQKWKRDSWTQHLFGRILKPSLGKAFEIEWTSSLVATHASHSAQQASEPAKTTQGISGPLFQPELLSCDPESASSRTSKDTSLLDSKKSLQTWKASVIKRRGEYSARLNAARFTKEKEFLSVQSWPTPNAADSIQGGTTQGNRKSPNLSIAAFGPAAPDNHSTHGSRPELLWPTHTNTGTGRVSDGKRGRDLESCITNPQAWSRPESWATPRCSMAQDKQQDSGKRRLGEQAQNGTTGKLNPRWVETLMGLPVGWTMPSCTHPIASPASVVTMSFAGNAEATTQTAHALGLIAVMNDNRTDELRLLGNGVVPATAVLAFTTLLNEQRNTRHLA